MEKFFSSFGKIAVIIIVFAGLMGAGYYFGRSGNFSFLPAVNPPTAATTVNPDALVTDTPTPTLPDVIPSVTPAPVNTKTVSAGLATTTGLAFGQYTLQTPQDWQVAHEFDNGIPMDTLTLTKAGAQIKIYQAATGGGICLFPGDTPFEGPSSNYTLFVEIAGTSGKTFRRGTTSGSGGYQGYTVCEKNTGGTNFMAPTSFGHVSYSTPAGTSDGILQEMDAIIASMKKI